MGRLSRAGLDQTSQGHRLLVHHAHILGVALMSDRRERFWEVTWNCHVRLSPESCRQEPNHRATPKGEWSLLWLVRYKLQTEHPTTTEEENRVRWRMGSLHHRWTEKKSVC